MHSHKTRALRWTLAGVIPALCLGTMTLTGPSGAQEAQNPPAKAIDPQAPPAKQQGQVYLTVDRIRTERKAIVADYMDLTDAEAKAFWPIYDAYQKDLEVPHKRLADLALRFGQAYPSVTNNEADKFLEDYLNAEKNILDRKRTFVGRFQKAIPAKKVLRLYQLENRMDATVDYNLVSELPLVK
jgi:hypothetical protein